MALYDPQTGKWYDYSPSTETQTYEKDMYGNPISGMSSGNLYDPSKLTEVDAGFGQYSGDDKPLLVNPHVSSPSDTAAKILQAQYQEWEKTYKPIEQMQMRQLSFNNPAILGQAVNQADTAATEMSDSMGGILGRQNAERGITPVGTQGAAMNRMIDINKALNVAGAENMTRSNVRTQDEQILMGGVPNRNMSGTK